MGVVSSLDLVIVTGLSGAGKTKTMGYLEDLGYYAMDNLPISLMSQFLDLASQTDGRISKIAVALDVRSSGFKTQFHSMLQRLRARDVHPRVIFLDASSRVLVNRFSETRRRHPLPGSTVSESIRNERELLAEVRDLSSVIIDTTDLTVAELKDRVREAILGSQQSQALTINIVSFGYKNGLPIDLDLLFDVRFLPNPYYDEHLAHRTGFDKGVILYVLREPYAREFFTRLADFVDFVLPRYQEEGKSYLTVGIGCTGGRHRSVVIANMLYHHLKPQAKAVHVFHRDLQK
ncbi:RNase adapter RapZ [Candidatus Cryosericum odellii]|uniref:RNase adapter RapZ n=1 Tax=Candidatus Cryosericum odellii TaxID=2290917 RepID=UPI0014033DA4|nr:RNase adapter RapZ [Candidatus Cryosericum odellii]